MIWWKSSHTYSGQRDREAYRDLAIPFLVSCIVGVRDRSMDLHHKLVLRGLYVHLHHILIGSLSIGADFSGLFSLILEVCRDSLLCWRSVTTVDIVVAFDLTASVVLNT